MPHRSGVFSGPRLTQGGLTLIELIVAIVILGILSVGATALIVRSVQNYQTNRAASELASQGETALTVMARGLHNAQPGSINSPNKQIVTFIRWQAPSSPTATPSSQKTGFRFQSGQQLQQQLIGNNWQVLAVNASGSFTPLPVGATASTASGMLVALTLSDPTADVSLTLSRVIAVLSSAYNLQN